MRASLRGYNPQRDFLRIRDFLKETYLAFEKPLNWGLERWNYARYFVAPMIGAYRKEHDLYVVGPDGEYVSCCIVWYDEHNKIGFFEPVVHVPATGRGVLSISANLRTQCSGAFVIPANPGSGSGVRRNDGAYYTQRLE